MIRISQIYEMIRISQTIFEGAHLFPSKSSISSSCKLPKAIAINLKIVLKSICSNSRQCINEGKIWQCPHEPTNSLFKKQIKKLNRHLDCGAPTPNKSKIVAKLNNLNAKSGIHSCPFSTLFEKCSSSIHGYPKANYHLSKHRSSN